MSDAYRTSAEPSRNDVPVPKDGNDLRIWVDPYCHKCGTSTLQPKYVAPVHQMTQKQWDHLGKLDDDYGGYAVLARQSEYKIKCQNGYSIETLKVTCARCGYCVGSFKCADYSENVG